MAFSGFERGHRKARTLLQICKELVKKSRQQSAYLSLAQTYLLLGDLNKALDCLANSLEIARETQDIFGEEIALGEIGCVYFKLQDFVKALSFFTSQLHIAKIFTFGRFRFALIGENLTAQSQGEPQGNWRWNSNSRDVVASSPSLSLSLIHI